MFKLRPVFLPCADPLSRSGEREASSTAAAASGGGQFDSLTLEFSDNPNASILRNIICIGRLDLETALRMAENVRDDRLLRETPSLEAKLHKQIAELMNRRRQDANLAPSSSFTPSPLAWAA